MCKQAQRQSCCSAVASDPLQERFLCHSGRLFTLITLVKSDFSSPYWQHAYDLAVMQLFAELDGLGTVTLDVAADEQLLEVKSRLVSLIGCPVPIADTVSLLCALRLVSCCRQIVNLFFAFPGCCCSFCALLRYRRSAMQSQPLASVACSSTSFT